MVFTASSLLQRNLLDVIQSKSGKYMHSIWQWIMHSQVRQNKSSLMSKSLYLKLTSDGLFSNGSDAGGCCHCLGSTHCSHQLAQYLAWTHRKSLVRLHGKLPLTGQAMKSLTLNLFCRVRSPEVRQHQSVGVALVYAVISCAFAMHDWLFDIVALVLFASHYYVDGLNIMQQTFRLFPLRILQRSLAAWVWLGQTLLISWNVCSPRMTLLGRLGPCCPTENWLRRKEAIQWTLLEYLTLVRHTVGLVWYLCHF